MKNKTIVWVVVVLLICILSVLSLHFYLLISKRGLHIHIGNFNIIRLGYPEAFFPAQFEQSFVPFDKNTPSTRVPRYERNTTYESELGGDKKGLVGDFMAKDIDTGKVDTYSWNENTHYLCLSPVDYQVRGLATPVDPLKSLKNYTFLNTGNNIGGVSAYDVGYYMFKRDIGVGTPVKFILKNETINNDGGLNILVAIVFTKHTTCAKPADTIPDLPTL